MYWRGPSPSDLIGESELNLQEPRCLLRSAQSRHHPLGSDPKSMTESSDLIKLKAIAGVEVHGTIGADLLTPRVLGSKNSKTVSWIGGVIGRNKGCKKLPPEGESVCKTPNWIWVRMNLHILSISALLKLWVEQDAATKTGRESRWGEIPTEDWLQVSLGSGENLGECR